MKSERQIIRQLLPELKLIQDKTLADGVLAVWINAWRASDLGHRLSELPFFHQTPDEPLMAHVRKVTRFALALAVATSEDDDSPRVDRDLLLAACLVHDVDKVLLYEPSEDGSGWQLSALSRRFAHGVLGAMLCREVGLPEAVVHLVATHALDATIPPEPYEGIVLHYADYFAADTTLWQHGKPLLLER